jgi:hypothetical protein
MSDWLCLPSNEKKDFSPPIMTMTLFLEHTKAMVIIQDVHMSDENIHVWLLLTLSILGSSPLCLSLLGIASLQTPLIVLPPQILHKRGQRKHLDISHQASDVGNVLLRITGLAGTCPAGIMGATTASFSIG